jgi:hypothetical protein
LIGLWNLQSYLVRGPERASWCYFVDYILAGFLEASYLNLNPGQIFSIFLHGLHMPISPRTLLPDIIKQMIQVKFTGLSVSQEIKLNMPI